MFHWHAAKRTRKLSVKIDRIQVIEAGNNAELADYSVDDAL